MQNIPNQIYKQGLVHNIYRNSGIITKIPKPEFPDFNNKNHFDIEAATLRFLNKNGLPCPKSVNISKVKILGSQFYCLKETFVKDKQFKNWETLSDKSLKEIVRTYNVAHKLKMTGAGPLDKNLKGVFQSWSLFILKSITDNFEYFKIHYPQFVGNYPNKQLGILDNLLKERNLEVNMFIFADLNPGNIFFDSEDNISCLIDIDHPMSGDPLYDFSSINWYDKRTFKKIINKKLIEFNLKDYKFICLYTLVFGLNVIVWRLQHELPCNEEFKQLAEEINYIETKFPKL